MSDRVIKEGTRLFCLHCKQKGPLVSDLIFESRNDISILCSNCNSEINISHNEVIPKIDPRIPDKTSFTIVYSIETDQIKKENSTTKEKNTNNIKQPTFSELSEDLWERIKDVIGSGDAIRNAIGKIEDSITTEMEKNILVCDMIRNDWKYGFIQEFIDRPFIALPCYSKNIYINSSSFYLISPKFFQPEFGISMNCGGGFNLQLVCNFSRLSGFALSDLQCKLFDFIEGVNIKNLDLKVYGNKIIGTDLVGLWDVIPGIMPDDDHTDKFPSIRIKDQHAAREWLVLNAVQPWQSIEIDESIIYQGIVSTVYNRTENFRETAEVVFNEFKTHSRILLNWGSGEEDRKEAIDICKFIAGSMQTNVVIVSKDSNFINNAASNRTTACPIETLRTFIMSYIESNSLSINDSLIIVDITSIINCGYVTSTNIDSLSTLFNYGGKLILVCSSEEYDNDLIDTIDNPDILIFLHSLVCKGVVKRKSNESWEQKNVAKLTELQRLLKNAGCKRE